ncbi:MAG: hypothetical protein WCX70_00900 [Candidatus Paceibacterota bacterium]|jgi:hypothetical protein
MEQNTLTMRTTNKLKSCWGRKTVFPSRQILRQDCVESNGSGIKLIPLLGEGGKEEHWFFLVKKICQRAGFIGENKCSLDELLQLVLIQSCELGFDVSYYRYSPADLKKRLSEILHTMEISYLVNFGSETDEIRFSLYKM